MKRFTNDTDTLRLQIDRSTIYFVIALTLLSLTRSTVQSYEVSIGNIQNGRPEVNRQSIAGIWKLIPTTSYHRTPMKEFTVYPKKPQIVPPELLLLLKEDGSFQQYQYDTGTAASTTSTIIDDDIDSKNVDIDISWKKFYYTKTNQLLLQQQHIKLYPWIQSIQTGKWNYLDGYLLLAADRIQQQSQSQQCQSSSSTTIDISSSSTSMKSVLSNDNTLSTTPTTTTSAATSFLHRSNDDTLLKGRVIASYQTRLEDNPIVSSKDDTNITTTATTTSITKSNSNNNNNKKIQLDTYLTIPRGTIHIGKFMYPKHHPSFFDQPMYQPIKMGTCTLRQIIGNVNMANNNNNNNNNYYYDKGSLKSKNNNYINQNNNNYDTNTPVVESYQRSDFYNKTFLLTSHPLQTQPVSSSKNDPYSKKRESKTTKSSPLSPSTGSVVRVLQIIFHPNNTFTTTGGLGNDIILRGKYDIIGNNQDHLWMQVIRFGFGRSVSGSVYSEGIMLSHEDIKAYWGTIRKIPYITTNITKTNNKNNSTNNAEFHHDDNVVDIDNDTLESSSFRIEVDGSVLDGIGLEPIPVARFMLREIDPSVTSTNSIDDDDDDDEDDDHDDDDDSNIEQLKSTIDIVLEDDGIDWTSTDESFQ